jgi:chlorobactene glucosyltransferase
VTAILLGLLPWVALAAFFLVGVREPRPLPAVPEDAGADGDLQVSVIVPARNEARFIVRCLEGLTRQRGVRFEVIVVDDRSTDGTGALARGVDPGNAEEVRVVAGQALPDGWFGKPWACHQGAQVARGDVLLFTDADTSHSPDLLTRCLAALREDGADALSLHGRQELGTFWERLVQPHLFALMAVRFRRLDRVLDREDSHRAIANGQYILVRREAYDAVDGHRAVRDEVVEDLRMAQVLTRSGHRLTMRGAEDAFSTRMYTSLRELVDGWTKNVAVGGRQAAGWWAPVALPGAVGFIVAAWLLAPGVGLAGAASWAFGGRPFSPTLMGWAGLTYGFSSVLWASGYRRFGVSLGYGFLHPLGALVTLHIVLRSWIRGTRRIEWKGRRYRGSRLEEPA